VVGCEVDYDVLEVLTVDNNGSVFVDVSRAEVLAFFDSLVERQDMDIRAILFAVADVCDDETSRCVLTMACAYRKQCASGDNRPFTKILVVKKWTNTKAN